jgi:hypothetical protein
MLSLHPSLLLYLPLPITSASTIIGSPTTPLQCCVPTLPVDLGIPLYLSTNNTSWVDYYYPDGVNTMDALSVSIQMVLAGFVLHTVDGVYVAMLFAWTFLKLEDGASNMATRSQLAAWMDALIRALRVDFAKDMDPPLLQCHQLYESRIQVKYVPNSLFFD